MIRRYRSRPFFTIRGAVVIAAVVVAAMLVGCLGAVYLNGVKL